MKLLWQEGENRVALATRDEERDRLLDLLESVGQREGWNPEKHLRLHQHSAVHLLGLRGCELAGGIQLVLSAPGRLLPGAHIWPEVVVSSDPATAHVSILAVTRVHRGSGLFWQLSTELWRYCVQHGIERLWFEVTPRTREIYRRIGWPMQLQGELRLHWGEPCYLCLMDIEALTCEFLRRAEQSDTYRTIVEQGTRDQIRMPAAAQLVDR